MTIRGTRRLGDPLLRQRASDALGVGAPAVAGIAVDLADTLADWVRRTGYGRGIAAPQIGVPTRVVYIALDEPMVLVNPVITDRSTATWQPWEACLSFSVEIFCRVRRARQVELVYQSLDGQQRALRADGELAHVVQHETDHLDGILAVDRITDMTTLCMRSEFELRHRDQSPYGRWAGSPKTSEREKQ